MLKHTIELQRLTAKKEELQLKITNLKKSIDSKKDVKSPKGLQSEI